MKIKINNNLTRIFDIKIRICENIILIFYLKL
jgi:hypothetical protein